MTQYLRQSTAATLKIGPFVDNAGAAATGLTLSQADIRLSKNAGNMAQKNESTSCTHDEIGVYDCPVDTTDTNTLGRLRLDVAESGALSVFHEYTVIPADLYDTMFTANANRGGVIVSGTIGSTGNSTTALHLTGLTYGDDEINGLLLVIKDVSTNERHARWIDDWADTGDLATVATLPFTPENAVDTYEILATRRDVDVTRWLGTAAATPTTAGVPEVDVTHWLGTAAATPTVAGVPEVDLTHVAGSTTSVSVLATNIAAILVDTGTTLDAKIDAIDDLLDTEMPALTAAVAALQTYPKNVAVAAFMFYMEDTNGAALTGATVSTFISKDGGAFAATATATATEVSSGWYKVALTQTEMNADEIAFRATATGARTCNLKLRTQG